jgi:hypothetical protein
MAAKLFGLDGSTVRQILKLHALDGATPRRVKKLFGLDSGTVRLIFEDFSSFVAAGTANLIQSPVNEVIDFGVRNDFDAGAATINVNTTGSGDASNVGGISGLSIDVDSSHTYTTASDISQSSGVAARRQSSGAYSQSVTRHHYVPNLTDLIPSPDASGGGGNASASAKQIGFEFRDALGGSSLSNWTSGSYLTIGGTQYSGTISGSNVTFASPGNVFIGYNSYWGFHVIRSDGPSYPSIGNIRIAGAPGISATGRRARVVNGSSQTFNISSGGLTAGGNFTTGNVSAGASTSFVTANSTSEAWSLVGSVSQTPAQYSISNADSTISVSGTFTANSNATSARDQIQAALNGNSTFVSKFNTGTDTDKTVSGVGHKVVRFTSDADENTSDFSMTITQNSGSNTTPHEETVTQGAEESLQTQVQVTRDVEGTQVSSTVAIASQANTDTAGAAVAGLGGDISYDSGTNKLKITDRDATVTVTNAGSLSFTKE